MSLDSETRFRCIMCGKLTAGKIPNAEGGFSADRSERYPRMHRQWDGSPCPGVYDFADWIECDLKGIPLEKQ